MHRLRSKSAIYRLRLAAVLLCARCLLVPVAAFTVIYAVVVHDDPLTLFGMGLVLLAALMVILQWLISVRAGCPLCMTPVLAKKSCTKHRNARSFLGSFRLRVALAIIFRNSFRCPYCHEPTVLEVRGKYRY